METYSTSEPNTEAQVQSILGESEGWIEFYHQNYDILYSIIELFNRPGAEFVRHENVLGLTTQYIANSLDKPIIYIRHQLSLWTTHFCTFYAKYGRIYYIPEKKMWRYEPKL